MDFLKKDEKVFIVSNYYRNKESHKRASLAWQNKFQSRCVTWQVTDFPVSLIPLNFRILGHGEGTFSSKNKLMYNYANVNNYLCVLN